MIPGLEGKVAFALAALIHGGLARGLKSAFTLKSRLAIDSELRVVGSYRGFYAPISDICTYSWME